MSREIKPLRYKSLRGFSDYTIHKHHEVVYTDHVKQLNIIENKIKTSDLENISQEAAYDLNGYKTEEIVEINQVKLHEAYFAQLSLSVPEPVGEIAKMIKKDFGSYEKWKLEFETLANISHNWVVLVFDFDDDSLKNYLVDSHSRGGVWNTIILLCIDLQEHAYFLNAAADKDAYIKIFFQNIDWDYVNLIVHQFNIIRRRNYKIKI